MTPTTQSFTFQSAAQNLRLELFRCIEEGFGTPGSTTENIMRLTIDLSDQLESADRSSLSSQMLLTIEGLHAAWKKFAYSTNYAARNENIEYSELNRKTFARKYELAKGITESLLEIKKNAARSPSAYMDIQSTDVTLGIHGVGLWQHSNARTFVPKLLSLKGPEGEMLRPVGELDVIFAITAALMFDFAEHPASASIENHTIKIVVKPRLA